jgi:FAD/FMN-containing dehydrogenase/Fe-S oxidoreductase
MKTFLKSEPPPEDFVHQLGQHVQETDFDYLTRLLFSTDASIYQMLPVGVAWPKNDQEVIAAVKTAAEHRIPVLPRGGGSSLAGQAIGPALILDFSRYMDGILDIDREAKLARVQPGVVLGTLNRALGRHGLMFGPDPASGDRATLGGIIGNNATGSHSIRYGMSHDHLLQTEAVLADGTAVEFSALPPQEWQARQKRPGLEGEIYTQVSRVLEEYREEIQTGYPDTFRTVAGYNLNILAEQEKPNLATLLAGSEGTLGIITSATLNLVPIPRYTHLYLVHFTEMRKALEVVPEILETGPSAVELIDDLLLSLTKSKPEYRDMLRFIQGSPEAILVVEYSGDRESQVSGQKGYLESFGPTVHLQHPADQDQVWKARKVGLGILLSKRGDAKPTTFIEDAAVPVEHLADYALTIRDFGREIGVSSTALYAHASAGCLHIRPMVNLKSERGLEQMRLLAEKSLELVKKFGGTTSGEHGEGVVRGEFSERLFDPELTRAFQEVKDSFDPAHHLNPGKIVNSPRMDSEVILRYGTTYRVPYKPEPTVLDFEEDHGFDGAVEMCNGAGVCRQLGQGVMCPSFQATRDEKHSTRGRANALRAAMTGQLGPNGMTSSELYEVLDLCLSCHACASECPSTVDMAKLKAEFLHGYYQQHGFPFRSWFFANIERVNKLSQPFAPLVNAVLASPFSQALSLIGIHPRRSLPKFAPQTFSRWYQQQEEEPAGEEQPEVLFFHDIYLEHNHPQIGQAAVAVLKKLGIRPIILPDRVDSGRPAFSKGLLSKARRLAETNLGLLEPYARQGIPIIGCEPSSMVMLVNEYPELVPGPAAELVAERAMLVEEYLVQVLEEGQIELQFDGKPRRILLHGHCQGKTYFGTESTRKLLEWIPNCTVEDSGAGCCGMAGAFGYEKEHYQISIDIAELRLAPAVRSAPPETIICAPGTSCREQIHHTAERTALHPLEVFAQALA